MPFREAKKQFAQQLDLYLHSASYGQTLSVKARQRRYDIVIKGRKFLASIDELNRLSQSERKSMYVHIVNCATAVLNDPSSSKIYSLFSESVNSMKKAWAIDSKSNYFGAGFNLLTHSLFFVAGSLTTVAGLMAMSQAMAAILLGTMLISVPWAILTIGIGMAIVGAFVAAITSAQVYNNYRFYNDRQLTEITHFVEFMNPDLSRRVLADRTEQFDSSLPQTVFYTPN